MSTLALSDCQFYKRGVNELLKVYIYVADVNLKG